MPHQHRAEINILPHSGSTEARLARSHGKNRTGYLPVHGRQATASEPSQRAADRVSAAISASLRKKLTAPARHFTSRASPAASSRGGPLAPLRATLSTTRNLPGKARSHKIPTANRPHQSHPRRRLLRISADQKPDSYAPAIGLEPSSYRFSEGLYPPGPREASISPALRCLHKGLSEMVRPD